MQNIDISEILKNGAEYRGKHVTVAGWVRTARDSKTMAFLALNDGTSLKHLQIVIDKTKFDQDTLATFMKNGASVLAEGVVVPAMKEGEFEINADKLELLGDCPADYPLQKKYHTMEFLRTIPHLRPRTNTMNAMLRVRSKLSFAIHRFFQENGYTYVHTPIITGSDCEGAGEIFRVTTQGYQDAKLAKDEAEYIANDFFRRKAGLTVAATDLLVPGVGEIIGCSEREENYDKLKQAMVERGMNLDDYKGYMDLRKYGTVPHSGFGLGLERILMYVTGIGNIRDVQLYSRTAGDLMA